MMLKKTVMAVVLAVASSAWAIKFEVVRDHTNCLYRCGEEAVFTVTVQDDDGMKARSGTVTWTLDAYNPGDKLAMGEVDLAAGNPFTVRGTLLKPGFLQLMLHAEGFKYPLNLGGWSVGYEPEKIRKGSMCPKDFDAFWADGRKKLAAIPMDMKIVPYPEKSGADWDYFRVSFATIGRRMYGFLSLPKNRKGGKFPAQLQVASAGWGDWTNFQPGRKGIVFLWLSVYPFEPSWDWATDGTTEKFEEMNLACRMKWGWGAGYPEAGISGMREDFFFYPVLLGMDRAVEWLATCPFVDASDITYRGGSQSGGLGIWLAGLNHRIRKAVTTVPAFTDTLAHRAGRVSSWPRLWEDAGTEERRAVVERNLAYYDAANFASRVKCPIRLTVGFRDGTCFPPCVYAAYNELKVEDKAILHAVDSGHGMPDTVTGQVGAWLSRRP